jgi:hypothetical protein
MSTNVTSSRFIVSSVTEFYQQLTRRISSVQELGNFLIREAERAQAFRQTDKLKGLGNILANLPLTEHSAIGQYYLVWCEYRSGQNVQGKLERIVEQTQTYKSKALFSLAAMVTNNGDVEGGARYYLEALELADNPSTFVGAVKGMAILKSMEGFKVSALRDLENISSIVKYANPKTYYDYLNSLAVETSEAGRNDEAQNISNIVLASPFINAYPEYRETGAEIARRGYKSRSSIRVKEIPRNIAYLPEPNPVSDTPTQSEAARVLSIEDWKKKMGKEPNGDDLPPDANEKDLYLKIMELIAQKDLSISELWQVIAFVEKLSAKPSKN